MVLALLDVNLYSTGDNMDFVEAFTRHMISLLA